MDSVPTHEPLVEYALGGVSNRNQCCTVSELNTLITKSNTLNLPLFRSYYLFPNGLGEHLRLHKTVRGYAGPVAVGTIVLDIDRGADSDSLVLSRARAFVERICNETELSNDHIRCYFSGTGFHIELGNVFEFGTGTDVPRIVKDTLTHVFPECDPIYDRTRLIRVENTINEKSKLYKIPLTDEEFWGLPIEDIHELAKKPRIGFQLKELDTEPVMIGRVRNILPLVPDKTKLNVDASTNFVTCTQEMYSEGPVEGSRHKKILRIASSHRRGGVPYEATLRNMIAWAPSINPPEIERLVQSVYSTPLLFGCHDELMKKYCSDKCFYYKWKNYGSLVATAETMEQEFSKYVNTDISNQSFELGEVFPTYMGEFRFQPGEMVVVWGDTKVGKTAFVQNMVVRLRRLKTLYISLEVHQHLIYRRFVQIAHGLSRHQVEDHYKGGGHSLSDPISHIQCISTPASASEIFTQIKSIQPQIVVIDTIDGIKTRHRNDPVAASNDIALELRDMASATNTILIGIHHISKGSLYDPFTGQKRALNVHSGKGSSTLEQKADKILGIELDALGHRIVRSLAARDEGEFSLVLSMDPTTFQFKEIIP